jgi:peptidoglycan lytic transglycosylase
MKNPPTPGWCAAATAVLLLASAAVPAVAVASSGGTSAPGADVLSTPTAIGLMPAGGAVSPMPIKPETLAPPTGGALAGEVTTVRGQLSLRDGNRPVLLECFDPKRGWQVVAKGRTNAIGAFAVSLRPRHIGRFMFRATTAQAATAATTAATPSAPIEVYRQVVATIFGDGDYGSRTACGQILTPELLGVAHLTLPCGTPVDITYGDRTITVPVVDRGPYVGGVSYDLTTATAAALGIDDTARIGALAIYTPTPPPTP